MTPADLGFKHVWCVDFEYQAPAGERPTPVCCVALDVVTGVRHRVWEDELRQSGPPYTLGRDSLFVAYFTSAEFSCHLALGWPLPVHVLDLYVEFRARTNGRPVPCGSGLLGALTYFGLDAMGATEKEEMRALALRGGPWTAAERAALLEYCESDVVALHRLLPPILNHLEQLPRGLSRARYRGQFMKAVAWMEHWGVPVDVEMLATLRHAWPTVKQRLIDRIDERFGVYEGKHFRQQRFGAWLQREGIPWPRLPSGKLALDDDTFKDQARAYPQVAPLRELRASLSQLRLEELAVGHDGRNRCLLSPFRASSGRNAPSNSKFIFGPSVWLRSLIRPEPGWALAYVDWSQQEFGIAAALSGDEAMAEAYTSGDPYLRFGQQAGRIPPDGTKHTHRALRDQFKTVALGVQYGIGEASLAGRLGSSIPIARELLRLHHETYRRFWTWSDDGADVAVLRRWTETVLGWRLRLGRDVNLRSVRNFPMQAHGAELLRLATGRAIRAGIRVVAPVHDAVLLEAPLEDINHVVDRMQAVMATASEQVLGGFRLRSEASIIRPPDRYEDPRGTAMWWTVQALLGEHTESDYAGLVTHAPSGD